MYPNFDQIVIEKDKILWVYFINLWAEDPDYIAETTDITDTPISEVLNLNEYLCNKEALKELRDKRVYITKTEDSLKEKKQKRWDTRIWTIEKKYWIDLWVRSDMKLSNYLDREGFGSLSKIIENR